ncbi:7SK snRNA methylphosphate capping enzyme [Strongyloides ratti]|uniref:RNA methyltransferase n=1 Tax=Strongyloides ratti TaxID=34506 RepID=A0A090KX01_STRRB|nr:7SK snRNA methylphosphate capping enzyme [Strongyloides ratti]CEF62035.1 7SK snRNA methylphosphate capping enzyme [Strongyloides ratti]
MSDVKDIPISNDGENVHNKTKKIKKIFRYGNYNRYYGRRKVDSATSLDPRLTLFPKNFFKSKKILDIGCNVGAVTLGIAKNFEPQMILGIDIDSHLIGVARKNIRHYCDKDIEIKGLYPASFFQENGKLREDLGHEDNIFSVNHFPNNVWFQHENYVLESDFHLEAVEQEYDVILALSITKWIHMNFGDDGMKRFFKRIFLHLNLGGKLVLESQDFKSYYKKAKQDKELLKNYKEIKFKPEEFKEYLLSDEVGFIKHEELGIPEGSGEGYGRMIEVFTKDTKFKSNRKRKIKENGGDNLNHEKKLPPSKVIKFNDSDED